MRDLTDAAQAALSSSSFAGIMLVEMDFDPTVYFSTAAVDIDWNGRTWLGAGPLGSIDNVKDSSEPGDQLKISLSGVPSENIALALEGSVRNRSCKVYFGILDGQSQQVLDAPLIWSGLLDQMSIDDDVANGSSTIGVTAKHIGSLFSRLKTIRYTAVDQQKVSPGDTSLRFIASQSVHKDIWPTSTWTPNASAVPSWFKPKPL